MPATYAIVKRNSTAHQQALASRQVKHEEVIAVGTTHVLIPAIRSINYGHDVSHAKNRIARRRMPAENTLHVATGKTVKAIRVSNHDRRTYKKVTKPVVQA
jgi:hypothetical protein